MLEYLNNIIIALSPAGYMLWVLIVYVLHKFSAKQQIAIRLLAILNWLQVVLVGTSIVAFIVYVAELYNLGYYYEWLNYMRRTSTTWYKLYFALLTLAYLLQLLFVFKKLRQSFVYSLSVGFLFYPIILSKCVHSTICGDILLSSYRFYWDEFVLIQLMSFIAYAMVIGGIYAVLYVTRWKKS